MKRKAEHAKKILGLLGLIALLSGGPAMAAEVGHYGPGVANIRDFIMPEAGFYAVLYNYYYMTERLNDGNGNEVKSYTYRFDRVPGKPSVTVDVDLDVDVYALAPVLIWVSPWKIAGASYGAYISPSFSNSSVAASLSISTGREIKVDDSQFAMADLFVQPLWFDWALDHWDFVLGYGFYAPVGKYDVQTVTLPVVGDVNVPDSDNVGLGFWTHQLQGAVNWYPWVHKGTCVSATLTYEIHHKKRDIDITPGSHLSLNWGISQYLPLTESENLMVEFGPSGYSQWQLTDDTGSRARNGDVHDWVHAAGAQVGLTYVPWSGVLNLRYLHEFSAGDRFQGRSVGLNLTIGF